MSELDKNKIRRLLISRLKDLLHKEDLQNKIDDFVEEYIEKSKFLKKYTVKNLPSQQEMKWWFQDKQDVNYVELADGTLEKNFEINIDKLCIDSKICTAIFKDYYDWYWEKGCIFPDTIQQIIDIYNKYKFSRKPEKKDTYKSLLVNFTLVGSVRMNKIERKPYMCQTEILKCLDHLMKSLNIISNIGTKKQSKTLPEKIYIFDAFNKMKVKDTNG
jgi:hypothetical protein